MKKKIKDFESSYSEKVATIEDDFFDKMDLGQVKNEVMDIINNIPSLKYLFDNRKLTISTFYRETGLEILTDYARNSENPRFSLTDDRAAYNPEQEFELKFLQVFKNIQEDFNKLKSSEASLKLITSAVMSLDNQPIKVELNMFPEMDDNLDRSESFDPDKDIISIAPINFVGTNVPSVSTDFFADLAHELGHAVDNVENDISKTLVSDMLHKYFDNVTNTNSAEVIDAIEHAQFLLNIEFESYYDAKEVYKENNGSYTINEEAEVLVEFVSFFAEMMFSLSSKAESVDNFSQQVEEYLKKGSQAYDEKKNKPSPYYSKLFAIDIIYSASVNYIDKIKKANPSTSEYFDKVKSVTDKIAKEHLSEIAKEIEATVDKGQIQDVVDKFVEEKAKELLDTNPDFYDNGGIDALIKALNNEAFNNELEKKLTVIIYDSKYSHIRDLTRVMGPDSARFFEKDVSGIIMQKVTGTTPFSEGSYLKLSISDVFLQSKKHYLQENSQKVLADLAKAKETASDLSEKIIQQQKALEQINEQLKSKPDDEDLKARQKGVNEQISKFEQEANEAQQEIQEKENEQKENAVNKEETDSDSQAADKERYEKGRQIFEGI